MNCCHDKIKISSPITSTFVIHEFPVKPICSLPRFPRQHRLVMQQSMLIMMRSNLQRKDKQTNRSFTARHPNILEAYTIQNQHMRQRTQCKLCCHKTRQGGLRVELPGKLLFNGSIETMTEVHRTQRKRYGCIYIYHTYKYTFHTLSVLNKEC